MTEDQQKIMDLLEKVSQDVARLQKERDEARAEASRSETQLQATLLQYRRDIGELGELLHDERNQVVAVTAERDAWRTEAETFKAEAARAVEALEAIRNELASISAGKEEDMRGNFTCGEAHGWLMAYLHAVRISTKINSKPALDWLAAQMREAAAEALENEARKGWSTPVTLRDRAAVLRAGEVTP